MSAWKKWLMFGATGLFLLLLGFGLTRDVQKLPSAIVGRPAPSFSLETLEGDTLASSELEGEVVVLNFWASWCIPCRQEHDVLKRAERVYADRPARVVGVVYQDSRANARRFMRRLGGDWPSVMDPGSRTAIAFGVYGVPETYFLAPDQEVARKHIGPLTWEVLASTVDSLLSVPAAAVERPAGGEAGP